MVQQEQDELPVEQPNLVEEYCALFYYSKVECLGPSEEV